MAYDDICKCSHIKRDHLYGEKCEAKAPISYEGPVVNGLAIVPSNANCDCEKFTDRFALPEQEDVTDFLSQLQAQIAEFKLLAAPVAMAYNSAKDEIAAIDEARKAAVAKRNAVESKMLEFDKLIAKANAAADAANRKQQQAIAAAESEAKFLALADSFDEITKDAPWKEWAFAYQIEDAKRMALSLTDNGRGCIVGNTMGTGKTLTSLIAQDMLENKRILIFTPATVMRTFSKEVARWAPHRNVFLMGGMNKTERRAAVIMLHMLKDTGGNFCVILNYESMRKDGAFIEELKTLEFDSVILDEAHSFKDKKSLTFRQVKEICNGDGHVPASIFPMTGSPILNKPQDIWPLLNLIAPYEFSDEYYFLQDYCVQNYQTGKWEFTSTGLAGMQRKLRNRFIRRTKEQTGINLPAKTILPHMITLDPVANPAQFKAYSELREQAAIWLDDEKAVSVTTALALITRERQMMTLPSGITWTDNDQSSPTYGEVIFKCDITDSVKLDYIIHANGSVDDPSWSEPGGLSAEIIEEKQVIMSQFKAPLRELKARYDAAVNAGNPEYACEIIDGDTPMARRQEFIDDFQNPDGRIRILLGNFKALGVGVTLTAATQMIILDEEWNPGKNEQAYDRIHRIGQEKPVTIHILRVENSIDDWMSDLNDQKAGLVEGFNSTVDISQAYIQRILRGE